MQLQPGDRVRSKIYQPGICDEYEEGKIVRLVSSSIAVVSFDIIEIGVQTQLLERIQ